MIIGEYGEAHPKRALADAFGARGEIGADDRGVGRQVPHAMALAPSGEVDPTIGIGLLGARGDRGACEFDCAVEGLGERRAASGPAARSATDGGRTSPAM
jgi:hypothetical protein